MQVIQQTILIAVACLAATPATAQDAPQAVADAVAPFLDTQTIAVAHLSLEDVEIAPAVAELMSLPGPQDNQPPSANEIAARAQDWLRQVHAAGAEHLFIVISLTDLPDEGPFLVASFGEAGNPGQIAELLGRKPSETPPSNSPFTVIDYFFGSPAVVAGRAKTVERLRLQIRTGDRTPPPQLAAALAAVADAPAQLVVVPGEDHRRVVREMLPAMQWPLPGISGEMIADGLVWAAVGIDPAGPDLQIVVESENDVAAARLAQAINQRLDLAARLLQVRQIFERPEEVLTALKPAHEANRLVWHLDAQSGHLNQIVEKLLAPPIRAARMAAQRAGRMNRLRQIGIAMHNYHDVNKTFAPHAIHGPDGKPLLSWRVALLPYLEGNEIYRQLRLDEPWDSPHNIQFVERMPDVFADPALPHLAAEGKTTYQVPVHEATVFPPAGEGVPIKEIKDGTSKTIMCVEVVPERAVLWTKPQDWEVDPADPLAGVQRVDRQAFSVLFCDDHAETMAVDVDPQFLWKLLTRAGGEP